MIVMLSLASIIVEPHYSNSAYSKTPVIVKGSVGSDLVPISSMAQNSYIVNRQHSEYWS